MREISVENGKYQFITHDTGHVEILRYGEPWVDVGNKAIPALLADFEGLKAANAKLVAVATGAKEILERVRKVKKEGLSLDDERTLERLLERLTATLKDVGQVANHT